MSVFKNIIIIVYYVKKQLSYKHMYTEKKHEKQIRSTDYKLL